jgi:hypothetical protein
MKSGSDVLPIIGPQCRPAFNDSSARLLDRRADVGILTATRIPDFFLKVWELLT